MDGMELLFADDFYNTYGGQRPGWDLIFEAEAAGNWSRQDQAKAAIVLELSWGKTAASRTTSLALTISH